jgi:glucokinase
MDIYSDERVVMTLDAGGTNFVFSAIQAGREIIEPVIYAAEATDLDKCLNTIVRGFEKVKEILMVPPVAISFAFPGPADYQVGVIGNLPNFQCFSGGVALGPMLEGLFGLPTYINNDGDLFTFGESIAGFLPSINNRLDEAGVNRSYGNLFGITLGTGFGGGLVINGELSRGDNSASGEVWMTRNWLYPAFVSEYSVGVGPVQRVYKTHSGEEKNLSPKEIAQVAKGLIPGDQEAAGIAFKEMGIVIGEALAHVITLIDTPIVVGGGISGAYDLLIPHILSTFEGSIAHSESKSFPRVVSSVFDSESADSWKLFIKENQQEVKVPLIGTTVHYTSEKRIPIGRSKLGTSEAIGVGAYAFALAQLDQANFVNKSIVKI